MSPHAVSPPRVEQNGCHNDALQNGDTNGLSLPAQRNKSLLKPTEPNDIQDLICVGFGPASLAIAIALHDALEANDTTSISSLKDRSPKVMFLEKQPHFAWHSGMLLEGARMQITFIKDMATLRNPRSSFTFLNYLHQKNRLVPFTNLNSFLPQRVEFEDYLKWCASWFDNVVQYANQVVSVKPVRSSTGAIKPIEMFEVASRNDHTGQMTLQYARHVVIAVGGHGTIPPPFVQHSRIIHSSQHSHVTPKILSDPYAPHRIAVIGSGQSAAEIFDNLQSTYPNSRTTLIVRGAALKPSDDSPFVNEIFDPSRVDSFFSQPNDWRTSSNIEYRGTNYGVVRLDLLDRIYETLYIQRIRFGNDETEWKHRIITNSSVRAVETFEEVVRLSVATNGQKADCAMDFDLAIVATGYTRNLHEQLLQPARDLLPGGDQPGKLWTVSRDYRLQFEDGSVSQDAGVWLQGCNENTHGVGFGKHNTPAIDEIDDIQLSDTLLSILAVRGGEIVKSIFGGQSVDDE